MANNEENRNATGEVPTGEVPRVRKASEVHKRRATGRRKGDAPSAGSVSGSLQPVAEESQTDVAAEPSTLTKQVAKQAASAEQGGTVSQEQAPGSQESEPGEPAAAQASTEESTLDAAQPPQDDQAASGEPEAPDLASPDDAPSESEGGGKPKRRRWKLVVGILVGLLVAALLVFAGFVAGSRWVRFNDEADLRGNWFVYGTDVSISFEDGSIVINDDTSYAYSIDPTAKTIEYSFGNLAGRGRYWFNDARNIVVITDGGGYTMWSTLADDLAYDLRHLFGDNGLPTTDASIVLTRSVVTAPVVADNASGKEPSASAEAEAQPSKSASTETLMVSDIMMDEGSSGMEGESE